MEKTNTGSDHEVVPFAGTVSNAQTRIHTIGSVEHSGRPSLPIRAHPDVHGQPLSGAPVVLHIQAAVGVIEGSLGLVPHALRIPFALVYRYPASDRGFIEIRRVESLEEQDDGRVVVKV